MVRMDDRFTAVLAGLRDGDVETVDLSTPFLLFFPVNGATVATVGPVMGNETVSATNDVARRLDEVQFDLGEGPCWDALGQSEPVVERDFFRNGPRRWPSLYSAVRGEQIGSIFAFPLTVGPLRVGAVDLYARIPMELDEAQQQRASALAAAVAQRVVREALASDTAHSLPETPYSRRIVHQATGVVLAQVDVTPEDALLLIQTHAFSAGLSMMELSEQILAREVAFVRTNGRIEVES